MLPFQSGGLIVPLNDLRGVFNRFVKVEHHSGAFITLQNESVAFLFANFLHDFAHFAGYGVESLLLSQSHC